MRFVLLPFSKHEVDEKSLCCVRPFEGAIHRTVRLDDETSMLHFPVPYSQLSAEDCLMAGTTHGMRL